MTFEWHTEFASAETKTTSPDGGAFSRRLAKENRRMLEELAKLAELQSMILRSLSCPLQDDWDDTLHAARPFITQAHLNLETALTILREGS